MSKDDSIDRMTSLLNSLAIISMMDVLNEMGVQIASKDELYSHIHNEIDKTKKISHTNLIDVLPDQHHTKTTSITELTDHDKTAHDALGIDHASLSNVLPDQHHQAFTITDHDTTTRHPLGTVVPHDDHANLTNVLPDQHHNQIHGASDHDNTVPKDVLDKLLTNYVILIVPLGGGWTSSVTGSGVAAQYPLYLYIHTGTTANSSALYYTPVWLLNTGDINYRYIDWTKDIEIHFTIERDASDTEVVARFQLKETNTEGQLAGKGIGIEIQNLTLYGESYGNARETVSLGTLTQNRRTTIKIIKTGTTLQFYVNGTLAGTITGNNVPNTAATVSAYLVASIKNGTTGGIDTHYRVGDIKIIQKK
jgi:hypothetical protein